jgi:polysaccharide export outer membrane protein
MMKALLSIGLGALLAAGNMAAQDAAKQDAAKNVSKSGQIAPQSTAGADANYRIGAQDVLRIDVWKEAEVSRSVPVRPDGKISLPLLNDVQASGLTAMELANNITEGLKKFINSPQVTVTVSEINSRRVYVTGEVNGPGAYPLLPNMTVLQAITGARGFTQFARMKNIYVLRTENGRQVKHPFNYKNVIKGISSEDNITLQPGDTIVVP